jgi:hypothetical protein
MKVTDIVYGMQTVNIRMLHGTISYQANTGLHPTGLWLSQLYREAITTIADALNAPVLATEEVLKDLPKDAKIETTWNKGYTWSKCRYSQTPKWNGSHYGHWIEREGCPLIANGNGRIRSVVGCPKTAEYLRQFTLDGVRKVGV